MTRSWDESERRSMASSACWALGAEGGGRGSRGRRVCVRRKIFAVNGEEEWEAERGERTKRDARRGRAGQEVRAPTKRQVACA
jgi:hypothetical protein